MDYKLFRGWTDSQVKMVQNDQIPQGKTYAQCAYFSKRYLHKGFRPLRSKSTPNPRNLEFVKMHDSGMSYAQIAEKVGISRQRIGLIVKKCRTANAE